MTRIAEIARKTTETDISLKLNVDGIGKYDVKTGIGFFDHMLELFTRHAMMDLTLACNGDIRVDGHHTVEDVGICLGKAIEQALGDKKSIKRYGTATIPMDESLCMVSLDVSGRPFMQLNAEIPCGTVGGFEPQLTEEFFRAVAMNAGLTLHINMQYGTNAHHMIEAMFKAFARALREAVSMDSKETGIPSTKGLL